MFKKLSLLSVLNVAFALALPAKNLRSNIEPRATPKYLFVFGDSYSSTGFSWSKSQPNAANPMGNPTIGKGTSAGGYNWVNYLATKFNNSPLYVYDLAVGGSSVDQNVVNTLANDKTASDFPHELAGWVAHAQNHQSVSDWNGDNALFAVWFGVNDVHIGYNKGNIEDLYERDIRVLFENLDALHRGGAKHFAILNLPSITRTPEIRALGQTEIERIYKAQHVWADKLSSHFQQFIKTRSGISAHLIDTKTVFDRVLDNPGAYNLPNSWCVDGNGQSCPWASALHPGVKIHKEVAAAVASAIPSFFK